MELVFLSGIALAVLAAFLWAVHNVLIRIATAEGDVGDAIIVVMAINLLFVAPPALLLYFPSYDLSWSAAGAFAAAGVAGLMLGRICMFGGIQAIGASRTTPVVSASTLVAAMLAVVLLGESLTVRHVVGIVLIVAGVAVISWLTAADAGGDASWRETGLSLLLPLGAALFIGVEPIFIRFGLDTGTPILVGLTVMMTAAFVGYAGYRRIRFGVIFIPRDDPLLRWYAVAGLASTIGLVTYFGALAAAPVVLVVPIIQVSPLFVIALSAVFLPERLERVTWRLVGAALIVVIGAGLVSISG